MQRRRLLWHLVPPCALAAFAAALTAVFFQHGAWRAWVLSQHVGPSAGTAVPAGALLLESLLIATVVSILAALVIFLAVRRVSRALDDIQRGARRFAEGDLGFRLGSQTSHELGTLAATLNKMAAQLDERFRTIVTQRNEQEAMLASMAEGVIAIDAQDRVLIANQAARSLLSPKAPALQGRALPEVIRNIDVLRLVERCRAMRRAMEQEITLHGDREMTLQVRCSPLSGDTKDGPGALLVLHDITRLRRLESVRREFVANVSHELKTPLTSIRGFVETLMDGAAGDPAETSRFLGIIHRQVQRLQAVIDDLLSLSRIEQDVDRDDLPLQEGNVRDVLNAAIQTVAPAARAKQIRIQFQCPADVVVPMHAALLEQAAINLLDNAVKYSDPGKDIDVQVLNDRGQWVLRFKDAGQGIDAQHLPRIFERFYRVDKARSRKAGGTGLGLSIVKHIVLAHRGRVDVASTPGQGSTFSIVLPAGT